MSLFFWGFLPCDLHSCICRLELRDEMFLVDVQLHKDQQLAAWASVEESICTQWQSCVINRSKLEYLQPHYFSCSGFRFATSLKKNNWGQTVQQFKNVCQYTAARNFDILPSIGYSYQRTNSAKTSWMLVSCAPSGCTALKTTQFYEGYKLGVWNTLANHCQQTHLQCELRFYHLKCKTNISAWFRNATGVSWPEWLGCYLYQRLFGKWMLCCVHEGGKWPSRLLQAQSSIAMHFAPEVTCTSIMALIMLKGAYRFWKNTGCHSRNVFYKDISYNVKYFEWSGWLEKCCVNAVHLLFAHIYGLSAVPLKCYY